MGIEKVENKISQPSNIQHTETPVDNKDEKRVRIIELEKRNHKILDQLEKLDRDPKKLQLQADMQKLKESIFGKEAEDGEVLNLPNFRTKVVYDKPASKPADLEGELMPALQLREKQFKELMSTLSPQIRILKEEYMRNIEAIRTLKVESGEINGGSSVESQHKMIDMLYPTE